MTPALRRAVYDSREDPVAGRMACALRRGGMLSVDQLAARLEIGRGEVDECAAELRSLGYDVEHSQDAYGRRRAYLLGSRPAPLALPWEVCGCERGGGVGEAAGLESYLSRPLLGSRAVFYGSTGSTQDEARSLAAKCPAGEANGLVVVAGMQTAGRGRLGRRWVSPPGGLWMSVVLEPGPPADAATLVPLAASLALADAVLDATGLQADLKWPNDLLVGGRKAAGILVDASAGAGARLDSVVVGIGVNLAVDAARVDAAAGVPRGHDGAASLVPPGAGEAAPDPARLARLFLTRLGVEMERLADGGAEVTASVASRWAARSSMIGSEVEAEYDGRTIRGTAIGVHRDGALLVAQGSAARRIVAGDAVSVRRARQEGA